MEIRLVASPLVFKHESRRLQRRTYQSVAAFRDAFELVRRLALVPLRAIGLARSRVSGLESFSCYDSGSCSLVLRTRDGEGFIANQAGWMVRDMARFPSQRSLHHHRFRSSDHAPRDTSLV